MFGTLKAETDYTLDFTPKTPEPGSLPDLGLVAPQSSSQSRAPAEAPVNKVNLRSEASIRAGVARVKGDMRTLATAIESYNIDYNAYPEKMAPSLTTPVAFIMYIPNDGFSKTGKQPIHYKKVGDRSWILWSVGPDQTNDRAELEFDPTNGTVSTGDVIRRSQR